MNQIYLQRGTVLIPITLDSAGCLELSTLLPSHLVAADILEWKMQAEHGDVFIVDAETKLVSLDLETEHNNPGPTKLVKKQPVAGIKN